MPRRHGPEDKYKSISESTIFFLGLLIGFIYGLLFCSFYL